jgi:hypothetical protein
MAVGGLFFFLFLRSLKAVDREDPTLLSDFFGSGLAFLFKWKRVSYVNRSHVLDD